MIINARGWVRCKPGPDQSRTTSLREGSNVQRSDLNLRLDGRLDYVFLFTFRLLDDSWTRVLRI